ncbi:hypothetical protein AB0I27_06820 [Streptomyces sp. NPDC050597]|uniref:hypothetical protein n=1 Tax=Streptomyces sp. NPDC050597 TaxID=3157212 RepID=UPI0034499845
MSPRRQQRAPKGRNRDRADRRAVADVLLARLRRGVLSPAEVALLAEHVREEQRVADENRRAMAGTTQALDRHRAAADAAIVEAEQRAERAEQQLAPVEAALAEIRRRHRAASERVDRLLAALARVRNAQSLGDALAAVAEHDGLSPTAARIHARILDRSDSTEARLAEQQRDHDIALAIERRRGDRWQRHALDADHQASRYRTAWLACRRDRHADRAAMAAELPDVLAGQQARATAPAAH